jgi:DNA repair exonuclease SbcCD ATPase subunit
MKKVVLHSIALRNFRGEKERTTSFNHDGETTIMGDNGLGKSRHFDAFMWLLFGKDTKDRKDYNVRTIEGKEPIHRVECSVSATLEIDGRPLTIKRLFTEKWVKPRGQVDEIFKGNETECFWNDVPVSVTDYQKRINEIINDSVFKMVTNPMFFATMKWQDQREQLFQLAGTITDDEISAQNPEFAVLLDKITGKSFADFKREIAARKKRLKDDLVQIQPRIDQTYRLMPETLDFATLEKQAVSIEKEITGIDKSIADKSEATQQQYEAVQKKQVEINELKQKQQKVFFDAQSKAREDAFSANEKRRDTENKIRVAETETANLERAIDNNKQEMKSVQVRIGIQTKECDALRQTWFEENAKEYEEKDTCLVCPVFKINCADTNALGLYAENKGKARASFVEMKQVKLEEITKNGKKVSENAALLGKEADKLAKKDSELHAELKEQQETLASLKSKLAGMPLADAKAVVPDELPEYKTLGDVIKGLEAVVRDMGLVDPSDTAELRTKKITLQNDLRRLQTRLADRDLITKYQGEIKALEKQGKDLAQQIADVEREEYTIQQFTKARIDECERRINGLFSHVTFKLFDYTIDGNEYETCVPLVNGVPFDVANTAGQVNAGLDIINALVRFHGVCAPIFIDGRESVNRIIPTESQIINLVVSNDKELIIK